MILITGAVTARPETLAEVRRISLVHVHRSRAEPGCISHDVHIDVESPHRLVFVERWESEAAVRAHFVVPESRAFGRALASLAAEPPDMQLYQAEPVKL